MSKAILTCALNGVLTDPQQHPMVPVTPERMAQSAREAFNAGAAVMHVHFRSQQPGMGHLPSWEPRVAGEIVDAIRAACPGVIINQTTGVAGADISGPAALPEKHTSRNCRLQRRQLELLEAESRWAMGMAAHAFR